MLLILLVNAQNIVKNVTVLLDFQTLWHSPKISLIFQAKNYNDVRL